MSRAVDLDQGTAFVVTDLHGAWEPYARCRDRFLALHAQGQADRLIFLGDLIHGYGPPEADRSLDIILDILRLRDELGPDAVIVLLGNHEMPHIYGLTLSKGEMTFTPAFEHALGPHRERVIAFFKSLPFVARTAGGVILAHAGASASTAAPEAAERLLAWSHDALLSAADDLLARQDVQDLIARTFKWSPGQYEHMARYYLGADGPEDPRYTDLLRGLLISEGFEEFGLLWDLLFTQCEQGAGGGAIYRQVLQRFLAAFSRPEGPPAQVLVTGHIVTRGGHAIVAGQQLRLSSWTHARPNEAGVYLLFDVAQPVWLATDLEPLLHPVR
ncbi:MAG: hypothetical protein Kow00124_06090 [Anaerolineae bacterium]